MPESQKNERVLFICGYLNEDIVRERGLSSLNVAGTNRSARIAEALKAAGAEVVMLSSATMMRQKWTHELIHPQRELQREAFKVVFPWSVGLPFIGTLIEPLALALSVGQASRTQQRPTIVLLYNYYPGPLVAALVAKYIFGASMILEIEDVYIPRVDDWLGRGDARPIQQLACWALLKLALAACDSVLVPSRRFLRAARVNKKHAVVGGCIAVDESPSPVQKGASEPLTVLVGGKLDDEQGLGLVLDAIEILLSDRGTCDRLDFHFCGFAQDEQTLASRLQALSSRGGKVRYHGTLPSDQYRLLLAQADICVAMPNPHGRHAQTNTPSKVYEYLAHGKVVITTDVGDFRDIPPEVMSLCDWNAATLCLRLKEFVEDRESVIRMGRRASEFARAEYAPAATGARILSSLM